MIEKIKNTIRKFQVAIMNCRGMTLIEILVAMSILVIMAGATALYLPYYRATQTLKQGGLDVSNSLKVAQTLAISQAKDDYTVWQYVEGDDTSMICVIGSDDFALDPECETHGRKIELDDKLTLDSDYDQYYFKGQSASIYISDQFTDDNLALAEILVKHINFDKDGDPYHAIYIRNNNFNLQPKKVGEEGVPDKWAYDAGEGDDEQIEVPYCGNYILDANEQCESSAGINCPTGKTCDPMECICKTSDVPVTGRCGDGKIDTSLNERCDNNNTDDPGDDKGCVPGQTKCNSDCTACVTIPPVNLCGNGTIETYAGERCDTKGNTNPADDVGCDINSKCGTDCKSCVQVNCTDQNASNFGKPLPCEYKKDDGETCTKTDGSECASGICHANICLSTDEPGGTTCVLDEQCASDKCLSFFGLSRCVPLPDNSYGCTTGTDCASGCCKTLIGTIKRCQPASKCK